MIVVLFGLYSCISTLYTKGRFGFARDRLPGEWRSEVCTMRFGAKARLKLDLGIGSLASDIPQQYTPKPQIRNKWGLTEGNPELIWAWAVWLGVVSSMIHGTGAPPLLGYLS